MTDTDTTDRIRDPRFDLEDALTDISSLGAVLRELGDTDRCFSYLADRLEEHYQEARDAFCRIFKLDEYREDREAQQ